MFAGNCREHVSACLYWMGADGKMKEGILLGRLHIGKRVALKACRAQAAWASASREPGLPKTAF